MKTLRPLIMERRTRHTGRRIRSLATLAITVLVLNACTVALEPAYDAKIVEEVETLTAETQALFAAIPDGFTVDGYEDRKKSYTALAGRAATIKLYAEARPAPSGRLSSFFGNLFSAAAAPEDGEEEDAYANASSGFMDDYIRNLRRLAKRDAETITEFLGEAATFEAAQSAYLAALADYQRRYQDYVLGTGPKPAPLVEIPVAPAGTHQKNFVERRKTAMDDILADALFYEREVLNRNR